MRRITALLCQVVLVSGVFVGPFANAHLQGEEAVDAPHSGVHAHLPRVSDDSGRTAHHALDLLLLEVSRTSTHGALSVAFGDWTPSLDLLNRLTFDPADAAVQQDARGYASRAPPSSR